MKTFPKSAIFFLLLLVGGALAPCANGSARDHGGANRQMFAVRRSATVAARRSANESLFYAARPAMGTRFEIYLYAADRKQADESFDAAFAEIERVEADLSNYRPASELSRLNASAGKAETVTDADVFAFLRTAFYYSELSGGAFDPTVGRLMKAWGFYRRAGRVPNAEELRETLAQTGWRRVRLDAERRAVRFLAPELELDPGGIGKGWAVDAAAKLLRANLVERALISAGDSTIYAVGAPPGKTGWTARVPNPFDRAETVSSVVLRDESLSTSGNYEKFFALGGKTYCHIIDPRTGRPVEGVLQTSVVAPTATESDALSTAAFVLGANDGKRLIEKTANARALWIVENAGKRAVVAAGWTSPIAALASSAKR